MTISERIADRTSRSTTVHWFDTAIRLHTDSAAAAAYLASQHHTLAPPQYAESDVRNLNAVADAALLDAVRAAAAPVRLLESYQDEWYSCAMTSDSEHVFVSDEHNEHQHALVTTDFRSWGIVTQRPESVPVIATRTIRELVREDMLSVGGLMFHGSAAELPDGHGVIIAGNAGAGKTSSALRIALAGGHVIGTDRTFLVRRDGRWLAVGLPGSTRLGFGSADALGLVAKLRGRSPIRCRNPFRDGRPVPDTATITKMSLSNGEVHELLECGFVPATTAGSLVVLDSAMVDAPRATRIDPADVPTVLSEHLLVPDPNYRSRWLSRDTTPEAIDSVATLAGLAADLPVVRVTWNPVVHCDERTTEFLVESMLELLS